MSHHSDDEEDYSFDDDSDLEEEEPIMNRSGNKRGRSISDSVGGRGNKKKKPSGSIFIEDDDEEEEDDVEDGGDAETWLMPEILVNVHKDGEDSNVGVIRDVLPDGSCVVALGDTGEGETVMAIQSEVRIVCPRKNERVKIVGGNHRGSLAKLIGLDGSDGIVKLDDTLDIKILDLAVLAKLVHA